MTSFVREILSASGRLGEKEDLSTKTARLQKKLDEMKAEMRKDMENRYEEYISSFQEASELSNELNATVKEVETLTNTIKNHLLPDVAEASKDTEVLLGQLHELSATVKVCRRSR
jgi:GTP cyclohydrolase I